VLHVELGERVRSLPGQVLVRGRRVDHRRLILFHLAQKGGLDIEQFVELL